MPAAVRIGCWLNAWIAGRASADDAIGGIAAGGRTVLFRLGPEPDGDATGVAMLLGEIRRRGVSSVSAALPLPGELLGLGGPSSFNVDALEAGEALVLWGIGLGLVPTGRAVETTWVASAASPPAYLPDVATADRELKESLIETADALADLDVASWSSDAADALINLQTPVAFNAPMTFGSPAAARVMAAGLRCREIVRLGLRDEGGSLTVGASAARRDALLPLRRVASAAVVAACSSLDGR